MHRARGAFCRTRASLVFSCYTRDARRAVGSRGPRVASTVGQKRGCCRRVGVGGAELAGGAAHLGPRPRPACLARFAARGADGRRVQAARALRALVPVCDVVVVARIAHGARIVREGLLVSGNAVAQAEATTPGDGYGVQRACHTRRRRHCRQRGAVHINPTKCARAGACRIFVRPGGAGGARPAV